jgi:hypothetical protein
MGMVHDAEAVDRTIEREVACRKRRDQEQDGEDFFPRSESPGFHAHTSLGGRGTRNPNHRFGVNRIPCPLRCQGTQYREAVSQKTHPRPLRSVYIGTCMAHGKRDSIRFLIRPDLTGSNGWLALRGDLLLPGADDEEQKRDLARRFARTQVWFSDLDDFDSRSPSKIMAMSAAGAGHLNPAYLRWVLEILLLFCRFGKKRGRR